MWERGWEHAVAGDWGFVSENLRNQTETGDSSGGQLGIRTADFEGGLGNLSSLLFCSCVSIILYYIFFLNRIDR